MLGELNGGWAVANRLLAYERGVITMEIIAGYQRVWEELRDHARTARVNGGPLADARVRERLAESYTDIKLMRLANLRYITQYMRGAPPGAETSFMKLYWGTTEQRLYDLALELGGAATLAMPGSPLAVAGGEWLKGYLFSRAATVYGGTEDIQRNILAERHFGLPRG